MNTKQPNLNYVERPLGASRLLGAWGMPSQTDQGFVAVVTPASFPGRTHQPCDRRIGLLTGSAGIGLGQHGFAASRPGLAKPA
ncbi:MAG: hypothetical protein AAF750_03070 [Planctomycetota bacterium]